MTQRYIPEWDDHEPVDILARRAGSPGEIVGEFLPRPYEGHQGSKRSFVTIYPADSEEGRRQCEAVLSAIMDADAGVDHEFDMDVFGVYARAALDALRGVE